MITLVPRVDGKQLITCARSILVSSVPAVVPQLHPKCARLAVNREGRSIVHHGHWLGNRSGFATLRSVPE